MSNVFTLDSIVEAADKKYGNVEIAFGKGDSVSLINALRLSKESRTALIKLQSEMQEAEGDESVDQAELLADGIKIVAADKDAAERLLDLVGSDLAVLAEIFNRYTEGTQAGEASASRD